jgi:uncharacterized spore protein YtfJ
MSETKNIIDGLLDKAKDIARSETIVGDPIKFENLLVVPVVQVSIGFGAGGGSASDKNSGGAGGGGIRIEPSCFLVHDGNTIRLLPAKASKAKGMDSLIEKLPDLLTYAMDSMRGHNEQSSEDEDDK